MASTKSVLAQRVSCQLCYKPYVDPRILPCLHSFCQKCLHDEILKVCSPRSLQCPSCRLSVTVPVGGAGAFPPNLHLGFEVEVFGYVVKMEGESAVPCDSCVNKIDNPAVAFCCTCCEFLCVVCKDFHKRARRLLQHRVVGLGNESAALLPSILKPGDHHCFQPGHGENKLKCYCEACCCLVCHDCTVLNHRGHRYIDVATVANAQREEMRETVQHTGEALTKLDHAIDGNKGSVEQVEATKQNCESAINRSFEELHNTLEHRRKMLLSDLEAIYLSKMTALALQEEQFEKIQHDIGRHTEVISHILQTHSDHEVLALGGQIPNELKVILTSLETLSLLPNTHSSVTVSVENAHFVDELSRFGHLAVLKPSPCKSLWTSKCVAAKKDRAYQVQVVTMSTAGEPYPYGGLKVKAELRSEDAVPGEVEDQGDGTYIITLTPERAGPHQLLITVDDQHVLNSPHLLEVKSWDYRALRDANQVISVRGPWCVAVHQSGNIYVGSDDSCIYVFDQNGNPKGAIGCRGSCSGQFESPRGIAVKGDVIYVADWGNHRIQKLTIQGKFLHSFGSYGADEGQLTYPYAAIVDANERLIVSENSNYRVQVFGQDGKSLQVMKGKDTGIPIQEFLIPWGLALDPQGNIHVAGTCSNTVKVYTPEGSYVRTYGDTLSKPTGIAIDDEGFCLVCEWEGNCLTIFDAQGNKVHSISNGVSRPCGVSLSPDGTSLYVANFANNSVLKYCL